LPLVIGFVSLTGCTSAQNKREQAETNLQSWAATLVVVGEQWSAAHIPNGFARTAVDRVQQGIQQELNALPPDPINDDLRARGRELMGRTQQLRTAIERAESGAARAIPGQ
jgi:outer membrane murein-binding lipoprotein Lpp